MAGLIGSSGKVLRVQEFRASGTFTVPSGIKTVELFLVGGGAGGGPSNAGSGGFILRTKYDVSAKASCVVLIGAGGGVSGLGGDTSFDGVVTARGGSYGCPSPVSIIPSGLPGGEDGFGGHGTPGTAFSLPANGAGNQTGGGNAAGVANTGGGGAISGAGGSGYLRVEWYE